MSRSILLTALALSTTPLLASAGSATAAPAAAEWIQSSGGQRAYLGVSVSDSEDGVSVTEVMSGGGAAAAGVQSGDQLVSIDDQAIETFADLRRELEQREPGQTVPLTVRRNGEELRLNVTLGGPNAITERPRTERPRTERPRTERNRAERPGTERSGTERPGTERPGTERPHREALEELLRKREEFERQWNEEFAQELDRMRGRFEDGYGKLEEKLHESLSDDQDGDHDLEGMKKELEGWKRERLEALDQMRDSLREHGVLLPRHRAGGQGDGPNVYFYSPNGDEMWQGWPGGAGSGGRNHERPLMAMPQQGMDLDGLRESIDDLREQVRDLRQEIDQLRERRSR